MSAGAPGSKPPKNIFGFVLSLDNSKRISYICLVLPYFRQSVENLMLVWKPRERSELDRLYKLCRRMGAPRFLSAEEMQKWLYLHLDSFSRFHALNARGVLSAFRKAGVEVLDGLLKAIRALQGAHARASLREQLMLQAAVKSLRAPLRFFPKSLHPDVSAAR